jgi:hypothetical protein
MTASIFFIDLDSRISLSAPDIPEMADSRQPENG